MYTGHVAIALAARGIRRDVPLWILVFAAQACDWVELVAREFTPQRAASVLSHGYPFVMIASSTAAVAVWLWRRSLGAALTVLVVYLSHPVADFVTSFKSFWWGGPRVGFLLVERPLVDFVLQAILCLLGTMLYWRSLPIARRQQLSVVAPLTLLLSLQALSDLVLSSAPLRRELMGGRAPRLTRSLGTEK